MEIGEFENAPNEHDFKYGKLFFQNSYVYKNIKALKVVKEDYMV